jgi:hypothetical protein
MAKVGGARPGAGRPAGSLRQRHQDAVTKALAVGKSPVEFMLEIMRNENTDPRDRQWAAEKVAPYVHPRPAPIERTVEIDLPDTSTIAGVDQALDRIIAAIALGTISPSEGQSFMSVLETRRKAIETGDLVARIEKLEAAAAGKK